MRRLLAALALALSLLCPVALPVIAQHTAASQQNPQTQTVYITRTGKKYNRDGCRYLPASGIPIRLKDAKVKGVYGVQSMSAARIRPDRLLM